MTVYKMKHDTIHFSSVNRFKVEHYEKILSGISESDIKANSVEGRHALLIEMGLAGDCPLFEEYMRIRGKKQDYYDNYMEKAGKYTTSVIYDGKKTLVWYAAEDYATDMVKLKHGWVM